ncbi:hypothetical protein DFH08DRAFT_939660 [Mycena albidolilacea]|uniref:Uncharacterized protein n=1 Tax=Mycena albidolilacea TaxID=1033008 RepID=A0AAD6ZR24_9AGAR|nr:hypothetical protein DFH08DRAFT_939660 [Mycena albidolilacea]
MVHALVEAMKLKTPEFFCKAVRHLAAEEEMRVERLAMDLEEQFEFRSINLAHPFDASRYIWYRRYRRGTPGCSVAACTHPPRSGQLYTSQKCAGSDTEVEPPSPGGSTKGLYVRSRPTSMDGSIIEFPGFAFEVDFTQFGMTAAPAATVTSPIEPSFPFPTPLSFRRRYAASMKSRYTGTGTGTILKTNQAPIIAVKIVPRVLEDEPATPLPAKTSGWKALKNYLNDEPIPPHIADSQSRENTAPRFVVAGGNFNNITNITHPIPESDPTGKDPGRGLFRPIPDLTPPSPQTLKTSPSASWTCYTRYGWTSKITLFNTKWERGYENVLSAGARLQVENAGVYVSGRDRRGVSSSHRYRHPSFPQLYAASRSSALQATIFHDGDFST